jgi:hypothetical protein
VDLKNEDDLSPNILISASDKGFINGEIFKEWLRQFIQQTDASPENPVLLIVDGHSSRGNLEALELAQKSGVHLVILPSKSTHLLQPLDKAIFEVFKQKFRELLHEFVVAEEDSNQLIICESWSKLEVIQTATIVMQQVLTTERVKSAFACVGIEPFAPETTIAKIKKEKKKDLCDSDIRDVLTNTIVVEKKQKPKGSNRFCIFNRVLTSSDVISAFSRKEEKANQKEGELIEISNKFAVH